MTPILSQTALSAGIDTVCYTATDSYAVLSVNIVNTGSTAALVDLAISSGSTPSTENYLEYQTEITPNNMIERSGLIALNTYNIIVKSSTADVAVNVYGLGE
jgi:hypothetical protein